MKRYEDLTNKTFGRWTVIEDPKESTSDRDRYWICKCECGTIRKVRGSSLRKGASQSCGCLKKEKLQAKRLDLTGQTFDDLTVISKIEKDYSPGEQTRWNCKCKCGNICTRNTHTLRRKDLYSQCDECHKKDLIDMSKRDLKGQRFGKLIVIEETEERKNGNVVWKCKCDCGNTINVPTHSLTSSNTRSCGCINYSIGEQNIVNLLNQNNILFKKEYTNQELNCKRFDFAIYDSDNNIIRLIEFDGQQHYTDNQGLWNSTETLLNIQTRDKEKNEYAKKYNIPLVRIPYWKRDSITLDTIFGDKYLV